MFRSRFKKSMTIIAIIVQNLFAKDWKWQPAWRKTPPTRHHDARTPPLETQTALTNEHPRRVCPWDDERNAKENDWSDASDEFSQKQLRNATILVLRRQKPLTNALDGLYLPCVDRMLEARWVEGCAVSLSRRTCVWWKSRRGLPFTHVV